VDNLAGRGESMNMTFSEEEIMKVSTTVCDFAMFLLLGINGRIAHADQPHHAIMEDMSGAAKKYAPMLRADAAKRFKKIQNATAMIWKLLQVAEKNFRTLKGYWLLRDVYFGKTYVGGVAKQESKERKRMAV
jgi:hypothetical protein